nr:vegetative cell wall protein gp1-like [Aegilops tauschii subsp. strangulata]
MAAPPPATAFHLFWSATGPQRPSQPPPPTVARLSPWLARPSPSGPGSARTCRRLASRAAAAWIPAPPERLALAPSGRQPPLPPPRSPEPRIADPAPAVDPRRCPAGALLLRAARARPPPPSSFSVPVVSPAATCRAPNGRAAASHRVPPLLERHASPAPLPATSSHRGPPEPAVSPPKPVWARVSPHASPPGFLRRRRLDPGAARAPRNRALRPAPASAASSLAGAPHHRPRPCRRPSPVPRRSSAPPRRPRPRVPRRRAPPAFGASPPPRPRTGARRCRLLAGFAPSLAGVRLIPDPVRVDEIHQDTVPNAPPLDRFTPLHHPVPFSAR